MKRRDKAGGKAVKARRRKTLTPKRRNAPKALRRRSLSSAGLHKKLALLTRERDELLEQQAATSEVLMVVGSSPGNLAPVFKSMLANGTRLCEAKFGIMWLSEGNEFRCGALHNAPPALAEFRCREPVLRPHANSPVGRVTRTKQVVHVIDMTAEQRDAGDNSLVQFGGARTILAVPMLKDNELIGVITITARR